VLAIDLKPIFISLGVPRSAFMQVFRRQDAGRLNHPDFASLTSSQTAETRSWGTPEMRSQWSASITGLTKTSGSDNASAQAFQAVAQFCDDQATNPTGLRAPDSCFPLLQDFV
jgi:hypothetical protein